MLKYLDISEYQTVQNPNALNADGVILRIGYTGYGSNKPSLDKKFEQFYRAYHDAGVKIGIYYFTLAQNEAMVDMETSWVLDKIKDKQIELPIWVDVEEQAHSAGWTNLNKTVKGNLMARWCANIQKAGYYCGVYVGLNYSRHKIDMTPITIYDKWIAQYASKCTYKGFYGMWQYTSSENAQAHGIVSSHNRIDASQVYYDYATIIRSAGLNHLAPSGYYLNGYDYSPVFNPNYYVSRYPDLKAAFGNDANALWNHFVTFGMNEFRQASEEFDPVYYRKNNPDVEQAFGDNRPMYYFHYVACGKKEGRKGAE